MSAAGIAFAGYFVLIPHFAAWGAIGATAIALSLRFAVTLVLSQRIAPLPYRSIALSGLVGLTFMIVGILAQGFDLFLHIAIGAAGFCIIVLYVLSVGLLPPLKPVINMEMKKCRS